MSRLVVSGIRSGNLTAILRFEIEPIYQESLRLSRPDKGQPLPQEVWDRNLRWQLDIGQATMYAGPLAPHPVPLVEILYALDPSTHERVLAHHREVTEQIRQWRDGEIERLDRNLTKSAQSEERINTAERIERAVIDSLCTQAIQILNDELWRAEINIEKIQSTHA